ncbi:hypothetical protein L9Z17_03305 [Leptospira noguchii]|nr:hypothetical protein [Leptospira noguchii]
MIDAWSRDKTATFLNKQLVSMNSPPRAGVVGGDRSLFRVPGIIVSQKESGEIWDRVNKMIKEQSSLASNAFRDHFDRVQKIVTDGLSKGLKYQDIALQIQNATGVSERRAEFWAKDQTGKFSANKTNSGKQMPDFPASFGELKKTLRFEILIHMSQINFTSGENFPLLIAKVGCLLDWLPVTIIVVGAGQNLHGDHRDLKRIIRSLLVLPQNYTSPTSSNSINRSDFTFSKSESSRSDSSRQHSKNDFRSGFHFEISKGSNQHRSPLSRRI